MKQWSLGLLLLANLAMQAADIRTCRRLFNAAATNSHSLSLFVAYVEICADEANPLECGYKAAARMMDAGRQLNPFAALSRFKSGRDLLEKTISRAPEDCELRLIRFSIQLNAPRIVSYHGNLDEDKAELIRAVEEKRIAPSLLKMTRDLLQSSALCTPHELELLEKC